MRVSAKHSRDTIKRDPWRAFNWTTDWMNKRTRDRELDWLLLGRLGFINCSVTPPPVAGLCTIFNPIVILRLRVFDHWDCRVLSGCYKTLSTPHLNPIRCSHYANSGDAYSNNNNRFYATLLLQFLFCLLTQPQLSSEWYIKWMVKWRRDSFYCQWY